MGILIRKILFFGNLSLTHVQVLKILIIYIQKEQLLFLYINCDKLLVDNSFCYRKGKQ